MCSAPAAFEDVGCWVGLSSLTIPLTCVEFRLPLHVTSVGTSGVVLKWCDRASDHRTWNPYKLGLPRRCGRLRLVPSSRGAFSRTSRDPELTR